MLLRRSALLDWTNSESCVHPAIHPAHARAVLCDQSKRTMSGSKYGSRQQVDFFSQMGVAPAGITVKSNPPPKTDRRSRKTPSASNKSGRSHRLSLDCSVGHNKSAQDLDSAEHGSAVPATMESHRMAINASRPVSRRPNPSRGTSEFDGLPLSPAEKIKASRESPRAAFRAPTASPRTVQAFVPEPSDEWDEDEADDDFGEDDIRRLQVPSPTLILRASL